MTADAGCDDRDLDLIAAAQGGSRPALDAFVRRNERWVRGVIYSTLGHARHVDDVVQQVWTNVCQQIGSLVERRAWRGWLYRLSRNAAIDYGQAARRSERVARPMAEGTDVADQSATPDELAASDEGQRRILAAIGGLPAIYREPFILRHLEDWSYIRIGETLGLPVDTVETRLVRARRLLRESLASIVERNERE